MNSKIIGTILVKNEDRFVQQAIRNVSKFCDKIIVSDNYSTDNTFEILQRLEQEYTHLELNRLVDARDSMDLIRPFMGGKYWVFGVDGDEIYDPTGLQSFKKRIVSGHFDKWWVVFGNVLNCTFVDENSGLAKGYLAMPSRSMTKLYNFQVINGWEGPCGHRLSGGKPQFKDGYDATLRCDLYKNLAWEEAEFRCLHTCFTNRSSLDRTMKNDPLCSRPNITEIQNRSWPKRITALCLRLINKKGTSNWKKEKYARGPLVEKEVKGFFPSN